MNSLRKSLSCLLLGAAFAAAHAQDATTGSISGTITDSSGAIISGATITITNTDRNHVERTLKTNAEGYYTATALPLGNYMVSISDSGFTTVDIKALTLHVSDALTINRVLKPGSNGETVTVSADALQVNLQDASQSNVINGTQVDTLPMVSRNYESLVNLMPGVSFGGATDMLERGPVGVNGSSSTVSFAVNGGRNTSNNWTIDGADNLDRGANLTLYVYISPDAIGEFKVQRGQYSAQFGRNASGQIDVVTRSGTNQLHGAAYEFFRNDYLDANRSSNKLAVPFTKRAPYRYNDFGFRLGGPVWLPKIYNGRNKTFFFVSENWLREITYTSGTTPAYLPTTEELAGDFSNEWYYSSVSKNYVRGPVNVCTAFANNPTTQTNTCTAYGTKINAVSPTASAYVKDLYSTLPQITDAVQAANVAAGRDPHTYYAQLRNLYNNLDSVVRIDHQIGQKVSLLYRYAHDSFPDYIGAGTFIATPIPGLSPSQQNNPGTQQLGKGTFILSPTMVMNVGYAYSNGSIYTIPLGNTLQSKSPDVKPALPYGVTVGLIPTLAFQTLTTIGGGAQYIDHGINHQAFMDLTKTLGTHTFIVGASYTHYQKRENSTTSGNQSTFSFTGDGGYVGTNGNVTVPVPADTTQTYVTEAQSFGNFLLGNANGTTGFSQANRNPVVDINKQIYEGFVQDNWRAFPRLTLNIGVRYAYETAPFDAAGYGVNFNPDTYSAAQAPTINAAGQACFTGTCSQTGSNAGQGTAPNTSADYVGVNYLNGLIFSRLDSSKNNQKSPYGDYVNTVQKANFAPRFGWAFDVFGDGRTAFRGGYGWAYDDIETSYWETTDLNNPPAVTNYTVINTVLDSPTGGTVPTTPALAPTRIQGVPQHFITPYTQQYSMDIMQQMAPSLLFDIAFVGSHGTHLAGPEQINQIQPGAWRGKISPTQASAACTISGVAGDTPAFINSTCTLPLNQIKPYLGYFAVDAVRTIFSSNYNSLQSKITKRFTGTKSYIDANFTWSRNLTNSPADYSGFIQNIYNPNADYGRAALDRKLILALDGIWEVPWYRDQKGFKGRLIGGWMVSGIYSAVTGQGLTATASPSSSGTTTIYNNGTFTTPAVPNNPKGVLNDNAGLSVLGNTNNGMRPNQVADPNSSSNGLPLHGHGYLNKNNPWFNQAAFTAQDPLSNTPGTAHRGSINGPGYNRVDVAVFRTFRVYDNLTFKLRLDAFNVLNHNNVQTIGTTSTSSTFGLVTGYRDPRIIQIGGRFDF